MTKRKSLISLKEHFDTIHFYKYDYSLIKESDYKNYSSKLPIICRCKDENGIEHGIFYQDASHHIRGYGCPKCCKNGVKYTTDTFIKKVKIEHPHLLTDKCEYINAHTKVEIGCPKHDYFSIRPYLLLQNHGCPQCGNEQAGRLHSLSISEFIDKANNVHNNKYDYSKVDYKNNSTKICIICPEHGEFQQRPNRHLCGDGCPKCKESKLEREVAKYFTDFDRQKSFKWLKYVSNMYLDFYNDELKVGIECQGEQHFDSKNLFDNVELNKKRDHIKYNLCKENGIKLIYFFPKKFLKYCDEFYNDKECYHTINDLKESIYGTK